MSLVFNTPKSALNTTSKVIQNLKSGECPEPSLTTESVEYTENGEYSVATPEGFDGLSAVSVTVNIDTEAIADAAYAEGEAAQKAKLTSLNVTSNGTYNKEDGYNSVTVNVPSSEPNLEYGMFEDAHLYGDYHPSEGYDGFATISVSVSPSAKGTASNPFTSMNDITGEVETAGALVIGSYYSVTITEDDTIEYDPEETGDHYYRITKASTDSDYPDTSIMIVEGDVDSQDYGYQYKEWPTGFSLKAGDTILLCGTDVFEGGMSMIYAYNGNLDETTWASSGSSCPDWSSIGWDCNDVTASGIDADLAYTAQKKAEFEGGTITSFTNDSKLVFAPNVNYPANSISFYTNDHKLTFVPPIEYTGDNLVFYVSSMFDYCESLKYVDITLHNTTSIDNLFSNCTTLKTATLRNTSTVTSAKQVFRNCNYLEEAPLFDTSNVTSMSGMFQGCNQMLTTIPQYNTASVTDMSYFLNGCGRLVNIPLLNTSNVTSFANAFRGTSITSLPQLNTSEANDMSYAFNNCRSLTTIPQLDFGKVASFIFMFTGCTALTTLGGFTNLGKALNSTQQVFDLSASSVLTYQSIMNIINNLAAPDNTAVADATLKLSATSYALLSADDIAIATAKRWSVTSA